MKITVTDFIELKKTRVAEITQQLRKLASNPGRKAKATQHYVRDLSDELRALCKQIEVLKRIYFVKESI